MSFQVRFHISKNFLIQLTCQKKQEFSHNVESEICKRLSEVVDYLQASLKNLTNEESFLSHDEVAVSSKIANELIQFQRRLQSIVTKLKKLFQQMSGLYQHLWTCYLFVNFTLNKFQYFWGRFFHRKNSPSSIWYPCSFRNVARSTRRYFSSTLPNRQRIILAQNISSTFSCTHF